ncbi:RNA-binding 40 [Rhynchospora pubera]|uniref:RNA-binding 40 n=1 Tax=Rhynchospora pubera TaxID=906938 RepID=A0AAV8DB62_9POAL|nr:RNA-binding 40 [Rhynchospora pubera]KAJ4817047.1 RNA-binding 40 [Rhynchospora pubera]
MAFFRAPYPTLPHQPQPQPQPQPPPPPLETTTLLVKHLPEAMTEEMLSRLFSHYGASSVRPCAAGKLRNCAFVDFKDEATAYHAQCQLNRLSFLGKVLAVERASQINKKAQDEKSEEILSGSKPVQNEASINQKKLTSGPEPIAPTLGIDYPFPPHLEYQYPPPDGNILTNIVNALIAVPRFYTQEDEEGRKRKKVKREVIVGPAVDKSVAHESVGLNTVIVPKEPPVMKKKTPVLQIKIASKPVHQGTSEDSRDANEQKEITDMKEKEMVAEEQFATAQELENGKMPPEEILSLPMFKVSKYLNCIPIPPHHLLPPSDRKTLFLDLDHTLIVSNKVPPPEKFASADQIVLTPRNTTRYIIKRPGYTKMRVPEVLVATITRISLSQEGDSTGR